MAIGFGLIQFPRSVVSRVYKAVGDSLTFGYGLSDPSTQSYPAQLSVLLGKTVTNLGVSGYKVADLPSVSTPAGGVGTLLVLIGTNDLATSPTYDDITETLLASIDDYVEAEIALGWDVQVLCLLKRGDANVLVAPEIPELNARLVAVYGAPDISLNTKIGGLANTSDPTYYQGDTLHIVTAGDTELANIAYTALQTPTIKTPYLDGPTVPYGNRTGGDSITIKGFRFRGSPTVSIGGVACTGVSLVNSRTITCTTPNFVTAGKDNQSLTVTVVCSNGTISKSNAFFSWSPQANAATPTALVLRGDTSYTGGTWSDQSGNGRDFVQATGAQRPTVFTNLIGGHSGLQGVASASKFLQGPSFSTLTAAEIFMVYKLPADPPVSTEGAVWHWGTETTGDVIPYSDDHIYDSFARNLRFDSGAPAGHPFSSPCIYSVVSTSGEWTNYVNGTQLATTASGTVSWDATLSYLFRTWGSFYSDAVIGEVIMFTAKLSSGDRALMISYLKSRYGIS